MHSVYRYIGIALLLALALLFQVNSGASIFYLKPDLVLLLLFYQLSYGDEHFRVLAAWVMGLVVDVWTQSYLGLSAFVFAFIAFLWQWSWGRLANLSSLNQGLIIGLVVGCYRALRTFYSGLTPEFDWLWLLCFIGGIVIHTLLWMTISWPKRLRL